MTASSMISLPQGMIGVIEIGNYGDFFTRSYIFCPSLMLFSDSWSSDAAPGEEEVM